MLAIIGGLIAVVLGILGLVKWWLLFLKGLAATVPALLIMGGIIAVVAGVSSIKDKAAAEKEASKEKEEEKQEKKEENT